MLTQDGIWVSQPSRSNRPRGPGLLLDRDGVLVEERGYLSRVEDVRLALGATDMLRWAAAHNIPVAVVSNQSGIDRRYFDWAAYAAVEVEIMRLLAEKGLAIDLWIACGFHPDHTPDFNARH